MRLPSRRSFLIGGCAAAAATLAGVALAQRPRAFRSATPVPVTARPIDRLSATDPDRVSFGGLLFRSGLDLRSPVSAFGGFSGLWRSQDGRDIIALADNAQWLEARIETADGRLSGLSHAVMAPLALKSGELLPHTSYYDTESFVLSGRTVLVGAERNHAVIRLTRGRDGTLVGGVPLPASEKLKDLPDNAGLEAIGIAPQGTRLAGALVAVAEGGQGFILTGSRRGLFEVALSDGYGVTDLAFLDNGDVLFLERRFSVFGGFGCRLRRVEGTAIRPGGRVEGKVLYESEPSHQVDNMEGLALHREGGQTVLTLISDDNFNFMQRTLLLEFSLAA